MRKQGAMSNTIAMSGTVDLESNTKGQVGVATGLGRDNPILMCLSRCSCGNRLLE